MRTFVSFCLSLLFAQPVFADLLFSDNFNQGASNLWGNEVGNWVVSAGVYDAQSPGNAPLTYSSLPFNLVDFSVSVDINDVQDGGIWLRSQDNGNGVLLVTGGLTGAGTGLYWHEVVAGAPVSSLGFSGSFFTPGVTDATIRVDVIGNTYSAYINGILATSITSNLYSSGKVALYDFSNQTFDNFSISTVPEPSSLALLAIPLGVGFLTRSCRKWSLSKVK